MALNQQKLISILVNEASKLPERCTGYRAAVIDALGEIIALERQHRREGIYINQKIADQCNALGQFLTEKRND